MLKNVFSFVVIILTFLVKLIIVNSIFVQPVSAQAFTNNASNYLKRLSPNEGLSQSRVNKTVQDGQGFIWIATDMGLNRYDGYQVKSIDGPNRIFSTETITTLFIDNQQTLWVSTLYSGLFKIDTLSLKIKQVFNGQLTADKTVISEVISFEQGESGALWLGISGHVYSLNIQNGKLSHYFSLEHEDDLVRALYKEDNWLFCATGRGLYRLNILTKELLFIPHQVGNHHSEDSYNTKFLIKDEKLGLLMGTVDGLFQLKNITQKSVDEVSAKLIIPHLNIWQMIPFQGDYLIASDKGLFRLNRETLVLSLIVKLSDSIYQITDDSVLDVFEDSSGNLWLSSKSQGVLIWSAETLRFNHISASTIPNLSHDNVLAVYQDQDEILWIGTDNGLNRLDLTTGSNQAVLTTDDNKAVTGSQFIYNVFPYPNDESKLWLVNDNGLQIFDKHTLTAKPPLYNSQMLDIMNNQWPYGYYVIDNSKIIFTTAKSYYLYNSITGEVDALPWLNDVSPPDLTWRFIASISGKKDELLLVASGHLYQFNLRTKTSQLVYKVKSYQAQTYDFVDNWVVDHNNTLWLSMSGEGLIGLDLTSFKEKYRFEVSKILPSDNIYSLQLDDFNNLWFSSQLGLFRLDLASLHLEQFEADDGLLANEYNGSAHTKLKDHRLVFGSTRGLTVFDPQDFSLSSQNNSNQSSYQVTLTDLLLLSNEAKELSLRSANNIELAHDEYGLILKYSTLSFVRQAKTLYDIKLSGPDSFHFKNHNKNELLLPKLSSGKYQLQITAIHPVTGKASQPLLININSLPTPWLSVAAKVFYLVFFIMVIGLYTFNRNNRRRALKLAHEKTKESEQRMLLALKSSNSGVWDYHLSEDKLYDKRLTEELNYKSLTIPHSLQQHLEKVHYDDFHRLQKSWNDFVVGKSDNWDVSYQMLADDGQWLWYRDVGRIVSVDQEGKPLRVSGTYTNITQPKADEAKATLFGEAFSQINDWVLIVDAKLNPVSANKTFLNAFSSRTTDNLPSFEQVVNTLGEQKFQEFKEIISKIKPGESWQGEEVIETKQEAQHPVLIKINAIVKSGEKISHYVIVISDITVQKNAEEKLRHIAHYDYLTNLPNRKLILEKIEQTIEEHRINKQKSALFFIDLDKFKQVNDSLGHAVGDDLLRYVAQTLVSNVKARDLVARQSGDEFMILIDSFETIEHLSHLAQRIIKCLSEPLKLMGSHVNVSASIGIALYPDDATDSAQLIQKADLAMIHAKETGRSRFEFFTKEMNDKAQQRIALEGELQLGFNNNELVNYYQPIVDCAQQRLIGFELLLRWPHINGMISPATFIPIAEDIGLINQITERAIDRALTDYRRWQTQFDDSYVSINLSAIHILQEGLAATLQKLLIKHQLSADVVRLEITEGTLLSDKSIALLRLEELKSLGFKLLLDDFGTGYSSLTYLSKFPIDVIKIDQSFIRNLQSNSMNKPIIKSIVALANNLNLTCIAEGVETQEQLDYIRSLGCDVIQGYFFAKPAPIDEIISDNFKEKLNQLLSSQINGFRF